MRDADETNRTEAGTSRTVTTKAVVRAFADTVNRVLYCNERLVLERRGKRIAAIVPMADYDRLEAERHP
jgi:hypothetical protein